MNITEEDLKRLKDENQRLENENRGLKEDNDKLLDIIVQMKVTLNRMVNRYVLESREL